MHEPHFGMVALFGSGETSYNGGKVFEYVAGRLPSPLKIAVLETPAGFELNSAQVAGRVADFLGVRLQNYRPEVEVLPARRKGVEFSPDNPAVVRPLLHANLIFLGPGSPTYAVRQLQDSLAWHMLIARHRLGAAVTLTSAATIAAGARALPVYEIYKAGEDIHWRPGLDLFRAYNLSLVFVPHWNNQEGGAELDTSRCFMGQARFTPLMAMLPQDVTVVGIDEHTALIMLPGEGVCRVLGAGGVTVIRGGREQRAASGDAFPMSALGPYSPPTPEAGLPAEVWAEAVATQRAAERAPEAPQEVLELVEARQSARERRDWQTADELRGRVAALGWGIRDTDEGPQLEPLR